MDNSDLNANEYLRGIVLNLPEKPGIYQYLNSEGTIIYVGKAKNLKKRVYSYFNKTMNQEKQECLSAKLSI
jgi:excinuclease ABC subunit C